MSKIYKHKATDEKQLIADYFTQDELENKLSINYKEFMESRKGKKQEAFGILWLIEKTNNGYIKLVNLDGQQHGYDGILYKNQKFFIYESKLADQRSFTELIKSATKTINLVPSTRLPNLTAAITELKLKEYEKNISLRNEIELLDYYFLSIKNKQRPNIPNDRSIICLGKEISDDVKFEKMILSAKEMLDTFEGAIVIKYDKKK